jgi:hypothetical protein
MPSSIRPLREGFASLRALMNSALPLRTNALASRAVSTFRVWGSRSDRSCHQRDHPSHRAVGLLNLWASTSPLWLSRLLPVKHLDNTSCVLPVSPLSITPWCPPAAFRSCVHHRRSPDSARPTRSVQACSPPPPLSGSTLDVRATPVSIGCDCPFSAPPSAALPVPRA